MPSAKKLLKQRNGLNIYICAEFKIIPMKVNN